MAEQHQDHGIGEFLRSFTGGVDLRKAHRAIGRDAGLAFQILTREHAAALLSLEHCDVAIMDRSLAIGDSAEVHRRIVSALEAFLSGATPRDDWSLVAMHRDR